MEPELSLFLHTGRSFADAIESQLFGKPCFETGGKAFICFFGKSMVFKLPVEAHRVAMALEEAVLFDPSGKGRAMKEWVQLSYRHRDRWPDLAQEAFVYARE
ncbi:hypothetical protein [Taibaiella koreensis]|uniref:hypothetical protein n=1 Tax=Taibaiella koreensis TaxID=1268548 RepID=UPI000E59FF5E|nr:hypothetical protein [Taibaiella koreensis]